MKTSELIEKQQIIMNELDSYGCDFTSSGVQIESEMSYSKTSGGSIVVSDDIDFRDIFEDGIPEFIEVVHSWRDNGINTPRYPIKIVNFK